MAPSCEDVLKDGMYIFVPTVRVSLDNIVENVRVVFDVLNSFPASTGFDCFEAGRLLFCYWYFIPCGSGTTPGLPRPLCMDECLAIAEQLCVSEAQTVEGLFVDAPSEFVNPDCCNLTGLTGPIHNCCQPLGVFNSELTLVVSNYRGSLSCALSCSTLFFTR